MQGELGSPGPDLTVWGQLWGGLGVVGASEEPFPQGWGSGNGLGDIWLLGTRPALGRLEAAYLGLFYKLFSVSPGFVGNTEETNRDLYKLF